MGIHGLWQVLEPTGRPVNIHSLRGKVLAIDVSIWLHQLVKGFRDKDGNPLPNAHLLGVFHRVCKLLNYGIKPVFVFDGGIPALKRQTLAARRQKKIESLDKAELARQKLLSAYLQQQLQRQAKIALPPSMRMQAQINALSKSPGKSPSGSPKKRKAGATDLPQLSGVDDATKEGKKVDEDLEAFRAALIAKLEDDMDEVNPTANTSLSGSDEDDGADTNGYRYGVDYSENFTIIQAPEFDTLPLETQHEILFEMQESRKMNSWGKFDQMPKDLQSFSNFQMDRLVKRRTLQKKIQSVQQEMGQRHIHVQNLDDLLKMDYSNFEDKEIKITGSQNDGFVLIKTQTPPKGKDDKDEPKPGTSKATSITKPPDIITIDDFVEENSSDSDSNIKEEGKASVSSKISLQQQNVRNIASEEEDADLKLAIALSLRDMGKTETSENTYLLGTSKSDSSGNVKQKQAPSLEVNTFPKSTEPSNKQNDKGHDDFSLNMSHCAKFLDTVGFQLPKPKSVSENNDRKIITNSQVPVSSSVKQSESLTVQDSRSESESDGDFEEVDDEQTAQLPSMGHSDIVATVDLVNITKLTPEKDDIFADIFLKGDQKDEPSNPVEEVESIVASNVTDLPVSNSPGKWDFETRWESDSDIEADLLEMVMKESAEVASQKDKQSGLTSAKSLPAEFAVSHIADSEHTRLTVTETQAVDSPNATDSTEKQPDNNKIRMITADYMQAQQQLNNQLNKLHSEMGHQERIATSISDQMQIETQELISLFGIPYIVSPTEAESQCAFLDRACLTEGTITDDSDVWLFGGQRVYKNFFSQGQKHVELYQVADIQRVLNLDREKLIGLAIMIGSDYSDGIQGVGPVLALEILSEFTTSNLESFETLVKFREWWDEIQSKPVSIFSGSKLKEKLRKLKLRPGFPSKAVYDAFINPTIDTSTEAFKWGNPDLDAIRNYTKQKFGWEQSKCDSLLLPVLKKRQCELDQSRQLTLDSYISFGKMPTLDDGGKRKRGSKRIQTAVKRLKRVEVKSGELNLSSESDSDAETEGTSERSTFQKQVTNRVGKGKKSTLSSGKKTVAKNKRQQESTASSSSSTIQPSASNTTSTTMNRLISPKKPEIIPQRVQSESDKLKNKQKAIEIFKLKKNKP